MSTVNTTTSAETPPKIILREPTPPQRTEPRVTAAQIKKGCPARLQLIGEEIAKRFNEAQEQARRLDDQVTELKKLIAEAKELCDGGGFDAFREKFFPHLRKSRFYEWLAIGTNKKSVEEIRTSNRKRQAKHRANKAGALNSVTVTEKSEPEPEVLGTPTEDSAVQATSSATAQTSAPTKPLSLAKKITLVGFSAAVRELDRVTGNKKPRVLPRHPSRQTISPNLANFSSTLRTSRSPRLSSRRRSWLYPTTASFRRPNRPEI